MLGQEEATSSLLCQETTSDGGCDTARCYSTADAVYIGSSQIPVHGWLQACRGCQNWTASCLPVGPKEIPMCRRCQSLYKQATSGQYASSSSSHTDPLTVWLPQFVGMDSTQLSLQERQNMCQTALLELEATWELFMQNQCNKAPQAAQ
ncbi:hypothetical protein WJX72_006910 [[Myrmecia] bisecta]|uniref:Glucocorticoid receptor n=1 Tax=[Myrmecia] bisecta TaxID=41462 RepID=A0AAW1QRE2_9CHLO